MESMDKKSLIDTACQDLLTYGVWDGKHRFKYLIKKYGLRRTEAPQDLIFWPTGLLAAGLWQCRQEIEERQSAEKGAETSRRSDPEENDGRQEPAGIEWTLRRYYDRWIKKGCKILWLDDLLAGETLLRLWETYQGREDDSDVMNKKTAENYRQAAEKLAAFALSYPVDEAGSFPYREAQKNGFIFADSIGLACPFLYQYGVMCDRKETMELAVKQIVNFLAYGMDDTTGLPYHGYRIKDDCKYGIIGWGRAVGWLLRGMTGCMATAYGAERLTDSYVRIVDAALRYQRKDGYFSWQLQALEGPADTSATGMICAALRHGIALGILQDPKYEQALQAGKNAIEKSIKDGRVYDCSGECEGFGQYPQRYGAYPWALGAALML